MTLDVPPELAARREYSATWLDKIRTGVNDRVPRFKELEVDLSGICIFAFGSYGRGEASHASDVDLFVVDAPDPAKGQGAERKRSLTKIEEIRLKNALIEVCMDKLKRPKFDADGRFLEVHLLSDMLEALGGAQDDVKDYFSLRLLLLLESQPVLNPDVYRRVVDGFLGEYYRDHKEQEGFVPTYLINDIVRYWKTLCLNYEHRRRKRESKPEVTDADPVSFAKAMEQVKLENKLKSFKLTFSRIMTCFSSLAAFAHHARTEPVTIEFVGRTVEMTPTSRLEALAEHDKLRPLVAEVLEHYCWFLENLSVKTGIATEWLSDEANYKLAKTCRNEYRTAFYKLLTTAGDGGPVLTFITM